MTIDELQKAAAPGFQLNRQPGVPRGGQMHGAIDWLGRIFFWHSAAKGHNLRGVGDVTQVIEAVQRGDSKAADELLPLVYEELRKLAASKMANEAAGNTLQPTALVHEAWMRLVGNENPKFSGRAHFFAAAAEAMRRILIDRARHKRTLRHGGSQVRIDIQQLDLASPDADDQLLAVNEALDKLAAQDPVEAELVKLRYFVGLTTEEAATLLGISPRTAGNYWAHARTWLYHEITGHGSRV
jgi:RNA polymerase sigma factor (TIGR02999 family)